MSAFLGPIHYWLYKKIQLMENIEKTIIKTINFDKIDSISQETEKTIAPFLVEAPLDQVIDTNNIHAWLQEQITNVEQRQALLIRKIEENGYADIDELVNTVYQDFGHQSAQDANIENPNDLDLLFNKLNNYLLEGMPCDRVNQVVEQSTEALTWITAKCVHTHNWNSADISVERYYNFRASFINGFVTGVNPALKYTYKNDEQQVHTIEKEK